MFKAKAAKKINPLNEGAVVRMYKYAVNFLADSGFQQYEISNFAKPGYPCRHNLNYWDNQPYLGLGASAASYLDGVRRQFIADAEKYIKAVESQNLQFACEEKLSPKRRARETAALKIRTNAGIDFEWFEQRTGFDFLALETSASKEAFSKGLIRYQRKSGNVHGVVLTRKGLLFSDSVSSLFL